MTFRTEGGDVQGYSEKLKDWAREEMVRVFDELLDCEMGKITINMSKRRKDIEIVKESHSRFEEDVFKNT